MKFRTWSVPLALLAVCIAGFGLLIPKLGFYWDDWAKILVARLFGLSGYWQYYAGDRPLSAWTHIVLTPLLGTHPAAWQVFTLGMRWLSAWGMFACLRNLWPAARFQAALAAFVFLVHPVFTQQPAAVTFHQQWMQYALFFLSLNLMILAVRRPKNHWLLTGLSMAAFLVQVTITEYFAPLEIVRPLLLWFLAGEEKGTKRQRIVSTLRLWAPYLLIFAGYLIWRLFFIRLPGADPYRADLLFALFSTPLETISRLATTILVDTLQILISSWSGVFDLRLSAGAIAPFTLSTWVISAGTGFLLAFYLSRLDNDQLETQAASGQWQRQAAALGLLALFAGPVPAWISGRQVVYDFHSDRYALAAMFGASLILAALIDWLGRSSRQKATLLGLVAALAVGFHLRATNEYRWLWTNETRFFWQLSWRAPTIKPGTALLTENEIFPNQGLFSTSAALNLMYPQSENSRTLDYWFYTLRPRYANQVPEPLSLSFATTFRTLTFAGSTPGTLLVHFNPARGNCLWVLQAEDAADPTLSPLTRAFLPISNLSRIGTEPPPAGYPPQEMIGSEPAHGWCYYYEKASLARQVGDWPGVAALGDQARADGFLPSTAGSNSPHEWIPFIEGYARTGRWEEAAGLTTENYSLDPEYSGMYCNLWETLQDQLLPGQAVGDIIQPVRSQLGCDLPPRVRID